MTSFDRSEVTQAFVTAARMQATAGRARMVVSMACLALVIVLSLQLSGSVIGSVRTLTAGLERFALGEFDKPIVGLTDDELGQLAKQANQMAASLKRLADERDREDWLRNGRTGLLQELRGELEPTDAATRAIRFLLSRRFLVPGFERTYSGPWRPSVCHLRPGGTHLSATASRCRTSPGATPMTDSLPSVLLVDDDEANLLALEGQLGSLSCQLVRARSGNEALRQLLRRRFAVMLLDVRMPDMDGYEVARLARDHPATRDVSIVFVTAMHETEEYALRGYDTGAFDFLFKPVTPHVLRNKVQVFLDLYRGRETLRQEIEAHKRTLGQLERVSHFKSRFLANMSHELRTPLNAIIGFSEILSDDQRPGALSPEQKEQIGYVLSSGQHLLSLINDVLDLSRIEAGRIELHRERIGARELLEAARDTGRPLALKQGVELEVTLSGEVPPILADPVRLRQVLFNLLSNAIKFTPPGGKVRVVGSAKDGRLCLAFEDTGVGIRADDLPRLFREFERIEPVSGPRPEGTGLGLALTKRLVELHGGTIAVVSQPGVGSTFTVELPLDETAEALPDPVT